MISIFYLKKNQFIFSISFVFHFQKNYLHLLYKKNYYKISIWIQKLFLLAFTKNLQFYLQKYFNLFSFKKIDLYKLFKKT